jgi:DNA processing protein
MVPNIHINFDDERNSFLALSSIKGVGYWSLYRYAAEGKRFTPLLDDSLENKSHLEEALKIRISLTADIDWVSYLNELKLKAQQELNNLAKLGVRIIFNGEPNFPENLITIPDAPQWIFVQGNLALLNRNSIGIVGTRSPSKDGEFLAKYAVASLAKLDFPTISGLASGIDQIVHQESIRYGIPTIAILGTGIYTNYPAGSESLRSSIISSGGAILTEYLPHQRYSSENFIRRNRLQAALSRALMPIEWQIKSGTAHTVNFADKYGKKIINIYLPKTYELRPELAYSEQNYSAVSYLVPNNKELVVEVVRAVTAPKKNIPMQVILDI